MEDKAFYLSKTEFRVLASLEGAEQLYCFGLDQEEAPDREEEKLLQAILQIVKNGWGQLSGQGLELCGEMKELVGSIVRARFVAEAMDRTGGRTLCYFSETPALAEAAPDGSLRVGWLQPESLSAWLIQRLSLGKAYWETEEDADEAALSSEAAYLEKEKLENGGLTGILSRQEAELRFRDARDGEIRDRYWWIQGALNLWIVHADGGGQVYSVLPDSAEGRKKTQKEWEERIE